MRPARRILIFAGITGGLFLGANIVAERVAEQRIATEAQKSFGTPTAPAVSLEGFPIIVNVLRGNIPRASLVGENAKLDELQVARLTLTLEGLRASLSDFSAGKPIGIDRGLAIAEVTGTSITRYVRSRGHQVDIQVVPGGVVVTGRLEGAGTGRAEGTPKLTGRVLSFTPSKVSAQGRSVTGPALAVAKRKLSFEIDLPTLPGGIRNTALEYGRGSARLVARLQNAMIDLSKA